MAKPKALKNPEIRHRNGSITRHTTAIPASARTCAGKRLPSSMLMPTIGVTKDAHRSSHDSPPMPEAASAMYSLYNSNRVLHQSSCQQLQQLAPQLVGESCRLLSTNRRLKPTQTSGSLGR